MNKKVIAVICLMIILLSTFNFFSVQGKIGAIGEPFIIYTPDQQHSAEYHDGATNNHLFHVGNYWYKIQIFYDGDFDWVWMSTIDSNLSDWAIASSVTDLCAGTYQATLWDSVDAIYDAELGVFHCAWMHGWSGSGKPIYYKQGTPNATGGVTFDVTKTAVTTGHYSANIDICLMNGKPVIAASAKELPYITGDYIFYILFSSDGEGTSWIVTTAEIDHFVFPQVHAINSTHVYVIIGEGYGVDAPLYGFYASESITGTSIFTTITSEDVEGSSFSDVNGNKVSGFSTVSTNIITPTLYAELIPILYINTTKSLKMLFWNVTSETISGDIELIATSVEAYFPITPLCAMEGNIIWAGYWERIGGSCIFELYERNPITGVWSDGIEVFESTWAANRLCPSTMNKQPYDGILIITSQDGNSYNYGCDVEAKIMVITADLEDVDDDGADWVFTDWKYYRFNATVYDIVNNISIRFTMPTGEENIACGFFSDGDDWTYGSNMTYKSREGEPCVLQAGSWSQNETAGITSATFGIWFESRILDVWSGGVDAYGSYDGGAFFLVESDLFRIYSKGGFEMNFAATGAAGKLAGGTPFSLYGNNGSIVYNEIWYRDGQHIKLMPDIHFLAGLDPFYVRYGVDYSLGDGEWLQGWSIYINPKFVSYTGLFAANVWINHTDIWMNRGSYVDDQDLYMFYHGSVSGVGDAGHWKSWVDLWFSDKNASRVGAGRYNAYEFPMIDSADLWLRWLANNWGVKDNVLKEMSMEIPLLDTDNSTMISSEQIKMMRFWCELEVDDADSGQYVSIENYEAFDITHSRDLPLVGMPAPVFDETLIPTVGQRGILGALFSMFAGLGQWLSENIVFGGLNLWSTFVNFLDTIAGMVGAPKFFTNLFAWIYEALGYVYLSFEYVLSIVSSVFSLMGVLLAAFLTTMADLITAAVNTITMFTDMMAGGYGVGVDVWETFGISQWLTVAIIFYPLYLVILWDQEGMDTVISQLSLMFGILSWLFGFFVTLIQFVIRLITTIIESIPVAE